MNESESDTAGVRPASRASAKAKAVFHHMGNKKCDACLHRLFNHYNVVQPRGTHGYDFQWTCVVGDCRCSEPGYRDDEDDM